MLGQLEYTTVATVFSADFETGAQGFTVQNDPSGSPDPSFYLAGLWHLSTGRGAQPGHSASTSFYYGQGEGPDGGGSINIGVTRDSPNPTFGTITSPALALPAAQPGVALFLDFNYVLQTRGFPGFVDFAALEVNDGGGWTTLQRYDRVAERLEWRASDPVDLSAYAGRTVQLRWSFDTRLGPVGRFPEGWYVDDVRVRQVTLADYYRFTLSAGQSATVALTGLGGGNADLALLGPDGTTLALGHAGPSNVDEILSNFIATTTGTYYLRVTGDQGAEYSVVVTRNADFDTEGNNDIASAKELIAPEVGGRRWVLGAVEPVASGLFTTGNDGNQLITIDPQTGAGSVVGPFGTYSTYTAAFTPDGTLWTIIYGFDSSLARLATVDPTTGLATPVGSPNWTGSPLFSMDADAQGNLYAGNWNGTFFSVDKTTGQMTPIGFMGFFNTMDFAFDNNGTLWGLDDGFNLYTIDPATGAGTFRTSISGLNSNAMGLMVDPADNSLYVTTYTFDSNLYRLDPATGVATPVGPVAFLAGAGLSPSTSLNRPHPESGACTRTGQERLAGSAVRPPVPVTAPSSGASPCRGSACSTGLGGDRGHPAVTALRPGLAPWPDPPVGTRTGPKRWEHAVSGGVRSFGAGRGCW